jgi:hypothetical protein
MCNFQFATEAMQNPSKGGPVSLIVVTYVQKYNY